MITKNSKLNQTVNLGGKTFITARKFHEESEPFGSQGVTNRKIKELDIFKEMVKKKKIIIYDLEQAKKEQNNHIAALIRDNRYLPVMLIEKKIADDLIAELAEDHVGRHTSSEAIVADIVRDAPNIETSSKKSESDFTEIATAVRINEDGMVLSSDIHGFLGVKTEEAKWIKRRLEDIQAEKDNDYTVVIFDDGKSGARVKMNFYLTLDTAKEVMMMERRSTKAKQLRKYLIAAEKKLRQVAKASRLEPEPQEQTIEAKLAQAAIAAKKLKEIYDITGVKGAGASDAIYKFLNQEYQINLVTPDANAQQELPTLNELPPAHSQWVTPTKLGGYLGKLAEKVILGKEMNQLLCQAELQKSSGPRGGAPFTPTEKAKGLYAQTQTHISNHNGTKLKQSLVWDLEKTAEIMIDYVQ